MQFSHEPQSGPDPVQAEAVAASSPPDFADRLFQYCWRYVMFVGFLLGVLKWFVDKHTLESDGGPLGAVVGILFGICFFYMLNYLVWRHVQNKLIKVTWWCLMALVALLVVFALRRSGQESANRDASVPSPNSTPSKVALDPAHRPPQGEPSEGRTPSLMS